jgi:hypothetical protein
MRAVGLAFLFCGTLVFTYPWYARWVDHWMAFAPKDSVWLGGLLVACGALTLAIHRKWGS